MDETPPGDILAGIRGERRSAAGEISLPEMKRERVYTFSGLPTASYYVMVSASVRVNRSVVFSASLWKFPA